VTVRAQEALPEAPTDQPGLSHFWEVYRSEYDAISDQTYEELAKLPEFQDLVVAASAEDQQEQRRVSLELLRSAMEDGEWGAYAAYLATQGEAYGRMGLTFSSWLRAVSVVRQVLLPSLLAAYRSDPDRLVAAVNGMDGFLDWALAILGDQYEQTKEEALRHSEQQYRDLFEEAPYLYFLMDRQGRIEMVNHAALDLLSHTPESLIGRSLLELCPDQPGGAEAAQRILDHFSEGRPVRDQELRMLTSTGRHVWVRVSVGVVRDGSGELVAGRWMAKDITLLKAAEANLERRVAELAQANAKLRGLNEELQKFAWVAAHDLQEPLRKVRAFGDQLLESNEEHLDDWGRTCVSRMQQGAARMQVLIDDLLAFSRVTTQARPFEELDLNLIVRDVLSDLEVPIRKSGARVEVGELPTVEGDPTQMRQLFQNLIGNALKYRKKTERPQVRLDSEPADDDSEGVGFHRLTVEDYGIGFEPQYAEQIFEIFQRLHGRSEYEGSGIGLAICRKITERHGGSITAVGQPQEGAKFTVTLPRRQPPGGEQ
jgi:PAS domain S-box-containing protein